MHIAIDDTYGPAGAMPSKYVTGARRTYVAVEFPDAEAEEIRENIRECLAVLPEWLDNLPAEFHFTDIYNRRGAWAACPNKFNLIVFEAFAKIYRQYRWRVHVQTVDERTLADDKVEVSGIVDRIDLDTRDGQALFLLLVKLKGLVPPPPEPLVLRIDAGNGKPDSSFANKVFREWGDLYDGRFADSIAEPLIQIADFLAFSINRCTHLQFKDSKTDLDLWFLSLIGGMSIRSSDVIQKEVDPTFLMSDIDAIHAEDRRKKGLE